MTYLTEYALLNSLVLLMKSFRSRVETQGILLQENVIVMKN